MKSTTTNTQESTCIEIPFAKWYVWGHRIRLLTLPLISIIGVSITSFIFWEHGNVMAFLGFLPVFALWILTFWLMRDEWKRWWSKRPALILTDTGITANVLPFDMGEIPWTAITEVKDRTTFRLVKEIKLILDKPAIWIKREPRLRYRLLMRYMVLFTKTPCVWYSRHLGEKHQDVIRQIRAQYAIGQGDLSHHLVDH